MGHPQNPYRLHVAMARIRQAEGDPRRARGFHEAERLYTRDFIPDVRPLPAQEARTWSGWGGWTRRMPGPVR